MTAGDDGDARSAVEEPCQWLTTFPRPRPEQGEGQEGAPKDAVVAIWWLLWSRFGRRAEKRSPSVIPRDSSAEHLSTRT